MRGSTSVALAAACAGIAFYSVMDAVMKAVSIEIGAYNTLVWRLGVAVLLTGAIYACTRPTLPSRGTMKVHFARSILVAAMAIAFFWGIVRVPLAEAIALSFIAPLIALGLAALFLKESITAQSIWGSLLGLAGVAVVVAGRIGGSHSEETVLGMAAILFSAVVYAMNLVVARHQAQLAKPLEIAFFQNLFVLGLLALAAPWWLAVPAAQHWPGIGAAALLAIVSLLLLSWAYARAEAQVLLPVEYTAFIWASLMGWWMFGEKVTLATIAGTVLIVAGCVLAARKKGGHGAAPEAEAAFP
ncbi:DMT family transporter [Sphingomonas psychrotolerans]|uniref:DMT family transporter n=1 Tax=Sphingomonas psychrotolerans TaxID=1327635 RepID=A0ABU3N5V8_9SPHN|nr:DMT family transporter [Sphingomonas psychrotolerans]MDT8759912.1 DMT family transporter [Sphingomonas psychrotolerans]